MTGNDVSTDIEKLRQTIVMDLPATQGRWQIFGTPEYTGGVPGPTDFITLIAEFENVSPSWVEKQTGTVGEVWVAPESPRAWLTPAYKAMFANAKRNVINLSHDANCHPYSAKIRKSGRPVDGFICSKNCNVLLYISLSQPNQSPDEPDEPPSKI